MNWTWAQMWADERYRLLKLIGMAVFIVVALVGAGIGVGVAQQSGAFNAVASWPPALVKELELIGLVGFAFGAALIGFFVGLAVLHRKGPSSAFTDGRPFDWDLMFSGAVLWIVLMVGLAVIDGQTGTDIMNRLGQHDASTWALLAATGLAVFFVQSGGEEVVFRGYLQPYLGAWLGSRWLSVVLTTAIFTVLHLGEISLWGIASVALLGLTLGIAALRAGTIAPAVGLHVVNNWLGVLASPDITNASVTQQDFMYLVVLCAVWTLWLLYETGGRARAD